MRREKDAIEMGEMDKMDKTGKTEKMEKTGKTDTPAMEMSREAFCALLRQVFSSVGIVPIPDEDQAGKFYQFFLDLVETNKVMNLTAITDPREVVIKHFADSCALYLAVPDLGEKPYRVMDLGTGAGFPGIPLAILYPNLTLTLADSLNKRITFIKNETEKLGLTNVDAVHARAEDLGRNKQYRSKYDLIISRAVANLSTLAEYCLPFIHTSGCFIPYKSGIIEEEIGKSANALRLLCGKLENTVSFELPEGCGSRSLLVIRKEKETPAKYPRKSGLPGKEPL